MASVLPVSPALDRTPPTAPTPALAASNLIAGYQHRRRRQSIVSVKQLTAVPGQLIAVVGPNGSGKSTLLRTLVGAQAPLFGRIQVAGRDLRRLGRRDRARLLGTVLSDHSVPGRLRAGEVIASGRSSHHHLSDEDMAAAWRAAHQLGIANLWTAPFDRLSSGQRQRILVARTIAQDPAVVVLDEPTAYLDLPGRATLTAHLAKLTRGATLAVVLSTHDLDHALAHADHLWLVANGTVTVGAPEDLLADGTLAAAFTRGNLTLDPATATLRSAPPPGPVVEIVGSGLAAQLAARVAHRVGFRTQRDAATPLVAATDWQLTVGSKGWRLDCGGHHRHQHEGVTYEQLARTLRAHLR